METVDTVTNIKSLIKKATVLKSDNEESLYVEGQLIFSDHSLNSDEERVEFFIRMSKIHSFDLFNIEWYWMTNYGEDYLGLKNKINTVIYKYKP